MSITHILFAVLSFIAILSGILVIFSRNPVYSVLFLIVTFFAIAGHYILLNAQFLALARCPLDRAADRIAEVQRQPVATGLGSEIAVHGKDFDGDFALQRRQPHQRVDQPGQARIGGIDAPHQHVQRRTIAGADQRR